MASGFHFALLLCLTSGLLAAVSCCEEKEASCCPALCPPGWTQFGSRCFSFFNFGRPWPEAERMCLGAGGNLASVHSAEEHAFLKNYIQRVGGYYRPTWIGGFDHVKENMWLWTDGSRFDYNHWRANEPNNNGREHCVVMNYRGQDGWNDWNCNYTLPFLCSKDL